MFVPPPYPILAESRTEMTMAIAFFYITGYIFAKEKEFRSADAINVSADAEDTTECCNPGNSTPKQHTSP